jgi:hypothetical protein
VCDAPKAPVSLTVYCREDIGLDAKNQPAHILYFYVVVPRGGARASLLLADALDARWSGRCRHEGSHALLGHERALAGIEDGEVVSHD